MVLIKGFKCTPVTLRALEAFLLARGAGALDNPQEFIQAILLAQESDLSTTGLAADISEQGATAFSSLHHASVSPDSPPARSGTSTSRPNKAKPGRVPCSFCHDHYGKFYYHPVADCSSRLAMEERMAKRISGASAPPTAFAASSLPAPATSLALTVAPAGGELSYGAWLAALAVHDPTLFAQMVDNSEGIDT